MIFKCAGSSQWLLLE